MEVFLTKKLGEFLETNKENSDEKEFEKWSAHIFIVERKKNIIFTHKETLYSFFVLGLNKNDLKFLKERIINELKIQLESDKIDIEKALIYFNINSSENIYFLKTDNDQKTLGWTRDLLIVNQDIYEDYTQNKIVSSAYFAHNQMNHRLVGKRDYKSPIEMLLNKLNA